MTRIKKGLDLPIAGQPEQRVDAEKRARRVAVVGADYPGMRPTMAVAVGDVVKKGQALFTDKKTEGVVYTAPASGTVVSINRGPKRVLLSVVIETGDFGEVEFAAHEDIGRIGRDGVIDQLVTSGEWTALRMRPFAKVPAPDVVPDAIFVTAMDTNPLAADPSIIIMDRAEEFAAGLDVLAQLTEGQLYVCHAEGKFLPMGTDARITVEEFSGPHPAGLPGTHIHFLEPVSASKRVFYINYQDVIGFGHLFSTGSVLSDRVVSLAGPGAAEPRLIKTQLGADLEELTAGELVEGHQRVISGSVLSGRTAYGPEAYLGRYHQQVSILPEDHERKLLGYLHPGKKKHSVFPAFLSKFFGERDVEFSTSTNGSTRGMVPIGTYDAVMPLDMLATPLLRSLLVGDLEAAIDLGCLELDEEDVALCTYVCPSKYEFGPVLRSILTQIEKEG